MTYVIGALHYREGTMPASTTAGRDGRDSFAANWRYNLTSLWFYPAFASFWAVVENLVASSFGEVRRVLVLLVIVFITAWVCYWMRPFIDGHGRQALPRRAFTVAIASNVVLVLLSSWKPEGSVAHLLVGWATACMLGLDLDRRQYLVWVLLWAAGLLGLRAGIMLVSGADLSGYFPTGFQGWWALAFTVVFVPSAAWVQMWAWGLTLDVRRAGETRAELARVRERLRFAADLHDTQGHHLQVLALKTELAERLIDSDAEAARTAIGEARQIANTALEETRSLARGYREVSLREEIVNAAAVLEAAGAMVHVDVPDGLDDPLFATALREATTNILRHSSARQVEITGRLEPPTLRVVNDGAESGTRGDGSGLSSLAERFAGAGGHLQVEYADGRFKLTARLTDR